MNSILERAIAHFEEQGLKTIEVPEWGEPGIPLVIYFRPPTVHEKRRIFKPGKPLDDQELAVDALIQKALDKDGNRLFATADRPTLLEKTDARVIERIVESMYRAANVDEQEKN